ncbi:uncharacterized protein AMSG_03439 [Thecamonas trahens ATCC 50062]|uniref:phosphatidate phosphatase n=1 Tax=Thecamonas trahens ATCC 50062 TaxID=461836 RepID=A0A0L0D432_THETB|nr:hypothetical protein AMSG_03439 [Thecamonas trahens ATCC 50062]KNC47015.1 hypothetical protein AMSG_03439 [Thecamonas trahens ATCC 50062]|eukprot:XP_013759795.1 hypothetical protein AMSG_03439 [Thecamonas trahens ATCC 50062]
MSAVVRGLKSVVSALTDINPATLSGAIDVVATKHPDGHIESTPWHVRFGKMQIFSASATPVVRIRVNDKETDLAMVVGHAGEAYFISQEEAAHLEAAASGSAGGGETETNNALDSDDEPDSTSSDIALPAPHAVIRDDSISGGPSGELVLPESRLASAEPSPVSSTAASINGELTDDPDADDDDNSNDDDDGDDEDDDDLAGPAMFAFDEDSTNGSPERESTDSASGRFAPLSVERVAAHNLSQQSSVATNSPAIDALSPRSDGVLETDIPRSSRRWEWQWGEGPERREEAAGVDAGIHVPGSFHRHGSGRVATLKQRAVSASPELISRSLPDMSTAPATEKYDEMNTSVREVLMTRTPASPRRSRGWSSFIKSLFFSSSSTTSRADKAGQSDATSHGDASTSSAPVGTGNVTDSTQASSPAQLTALLNGGSVRVELSACGELLTSDEATGLSYAEACAIFDAHAISFEAFAADPVTHTRDASHIFRINDSFYVWSVAAPIIFAKVLFNRPLPADAFDGQPELSFDSGNDAFLTPQASSTPPLPTNPLSTSMPSMPSVPSGELGESGENDSAEDAEACVAAEDALTMQRRQKRLVPTPEELASLDLHDGANELTFVVRGWRGTCEQRAFLYLWSATNSRVVVSDLDGTVTSSDALGHVLPVLGVQWAHSGVSKLFDAIVSNGYKIVFLSSRAIGQMGLTRSYMDWVSEDGVHLPPGPILVSPDRLFTSFHREVILRKPEEFKIACLRSLRSVFPAQVNPFHAGFGNRITDAIAYAEVGIPTSRTFIIDHRGKVVRENLPSTTYKELKERVDYDDDAVAPSDEYGDFLFWKM